MHAEALGLQLVSLIWRYRTTLLALPVAYHSRTVGDHIICLACSLLFKSWGRSRIFPSQILISIVLAENRVLAVTCYCICLQRVTFQLLLYWLRVTPPVLFFSIAFSDGDVTVYCAFGRATVTHASNLLIAGWHF